MTEDAKRLKCDVCGKVTKWKQRSNEPVADKDLNGWKHLNLKGEQYFEQKDYCSKECVVKDLDEIYSLENIEQVN